MFSKLHINAYVVKGGIYELKKLRSEAILTLSTLTHSGEV